MSELKPMLDSASDDSLLRTVLRAAETDAPSAEAKARTIAALGISAPAVAAAGIALWKWVAALATLSVTVGVVAVMVNSEDEPKQPLTTTTAMVVETVVTAAAPPPTAAPSAEVAEAPSAMTSAPPLPAFVVKTASSAQPTPSAQPSLRAELALLDGAKAALAANDPSDALAKLNQHDREYRATGRGQLGDEATMLRIEALRAKGDQTAARAVAKRFLATHPGTTYEDRVTTLLGP